MGRRPREHVPGAFYHVVARGNCQGDIFFKDRHRLRFLRMLDDIARRLGLTTHAFCLMTNHVHLILQMLIGSVSQLAHQLLGRYSRWLNREVGRSGHLFERRHRSIRVESDRHLVELLRYIHLNPVRAGVVSRPEDYRWSSHRAYLGLEHRSDVTTSFCLGLVGRDRSSATRAYGSLFAQVDDDALPEIRSTRFVDDTESAIALERLKTGLSSVPLSASIGDILGAVVTRTSLTVERMASRDRTQDVATARAIAAKIVRDDPTKSISELARILQRDPSTLSGAASKLDRRLQHDSALEKFAEVVESLFPSLPSLTPIRHRPRIRGEPTSPCPAPIRKIRKIP